MVFKQFKKFLTLTLFIVLIISLPLLSADSTLYVDYAYLLEKYVDDNGLVNYKGIIKDKEILIRVTNRLQHVSKSDYDSLSREEKLAYLINAYNLYTIRSIIDAYPTKSITKIDGVWDKRKWYLFGKEVTINQIENEIIRPQFKEPEIHFALVCAAMGCPFLLNKPYSGDSVLEELKNQGRKFATTDTKTKFDKSAKKLAISKIFEWYGQDFQERFPKTKYLSYLNDKEGAVVTYLIGFLSTEDQTFIKNNKIKIIYLEYDWSLNEQK